MVNFGPVTAEIGLPVWGTPVNFNGFRVLASLPGTAATSLNGSQPNFHDVWPSYWYTISTFSVALAP